MTDVQPDVQPEDQDPEETVAAEDDDPATYIGDPE